MMQEPVSAEEIHTMLQHYLHGRPDLGFSKAIAAHILEPRSPFERESFPRPQRWFVLLLLVVSASAATFAYFNLWH
jgi:hypothetical protein